MAPLGSACKVKDHHANIFWSEEDGGYIADIPDLAFCSAFGATPEEALHEVEIARQAWLAACRERSSTNKASTPAC